MFILNPTKGLQHGCLEILFVPSSPRLCKCFQAPTEVDSCEWWTTAVWQNPGVWRRRMAVLVSFDRAGVLTGSHAEWRPIGGDWTTVWNWRCLTPGPASAPSPRPLLPVVTRGELPTSSYRRENCRLVSSVSTMLKACGRSTEMSAGSFLVSSAATPTC